MVGSDSSRTRETSTRRRRVWGLATVGLSLIQFLFLAHFFAPAISTPDANAYVAQGRRLAQTGKTALIVESPVQLVPAHWLPAGSEEASSLPKRFAKYPPGMALLTAPLQGLFGPAGALWIGPVLTSLAVLGTYALALAWLSAGWAFLAALLTALNPVLLYQAHWTGSHAAVVFFLVWGLVLLVRWEERGGVGLAAGAGSLLGFIPLVRYPETVLLAVAGVHGLSAWRRRRESLMEALVFGASAIIPSMGLAVRNQAAFGAFWRTGYAESGEQAAFSLHWMLDHAPDYLRALLGDGSGPVLVLGVFGLLWWSLDGKRRAEGILMTGLVLPLTLLYMAYYWPVDPVSLRFLAPTLPLLAICAAGFLGSLDDETGCETGSVSRKLHPAVRKAPLAAVSLAALTAFWGLPRTAAELTALKAANDQLTRVTKALSDTVPAGSILATDEDVGAQLDFMGLWKLADLRGLPGIRTPGPWSLGKGPGTGEMDWAGEVLAWAGDSTRVFLLLSAEAAPSLPGELRVVERIASTTPTARPRRFRAYGHPGDGEPGPGALPRPAGGARTAPPQPPGLLDRDGPHSGSYVLYEWVAG